MSAYSPSSYPVCGTQTKARLIWNSVKVSHKYYTIYTVLYTVYHPFLSKAKHFPETAL